MSRIYINENECIGCDNCVDLCPDLFKSGDFVPVVTDKDVTGNECAQAAVLYCPTDCIYIK